MNLSAGQWALFDSKLAEKHPETGCVIYKGCLNHNGYGRIGFRIKGKIKNYSTHRLSLMRHTGIYETELLACHSNSCSSRACCNPEHLRWDSQKGNMHDAIEKGTFTVQKKGEDNISAKLTNEQVLAIRKMVSEGNSQSKLAKEYGISQQHVSDLINRKVWKHI